VHARLGFVPQTDIRRLQQFATLRWRPKGTATSFGPNMFVQATWDHSGTPQDWIVRFPFSAQFGQTQFFYRHARMMERFDGIDFHEWENVANAFTSVLKWLAIGGSYASGTRPNYYPTPGLTPFLANFTDVFASVTIRPASRLLFDETYLYSRLSQPAASIFNNHIARSKVNYQFTSALSLRGIVDYSAVLPNPSLVSLDRTKHITADILATYLLHPGTAIYIGYTDNYDNLQEDGGLHPGGAPSFSTGRQLFVKASYLWRF
jgi:hypothetical protein